MSGLATTIPLLAPEAHAPAEPMLHNMSANAIGLSVAIKESTERFKSSASRCSTLLGFGKANTVCRARPPANRIVLKEYMTGCATAEMRVELLDGIRDEKKVQ